MNMRFRFFLALLELNELSDGKQKTQAIIHSNFAWYFLHFVVRTYIQHEVMKSQQFPLEINHFTKNKLIEIRCES